MAHAVVSDLVTPFVDAWPSLPEPQRRALESALLLDDSPSPFLDERAVASALLAVVRELARAGPVVVAIDDAQWADPASATALAFVARRLSDEPVALVFALRSAGGNSGRILMRAQEERRVVRIALEPLSLGGIRHILSTRLDVLPGRPTLRRVFEVSGGNPFYALELGRALVPRRGSVRPGSPLPVPEALAELVEDRLALLPQATQGALEVVASLAGATVVIVEAAGARGEDLVPALQAQLVAIEDDSIEFTHPLLAAAVIARIDPLRSRALHRLLASLVAAPEERARHLALAVVVPDADVAAALEEAAPAVRARGAPAAAAELLEQAFRLTPAHLVDDAARRVLAAAEVAFESGSYERATGLVEELRALSPAHGARALGLLARIRLIEAGPAAAKELFAESLVVAGADPRLEAEAGVGLAWCVYLGGGDLEEAARHASRAAALASGAGDEVVLALATAIGALLQALLGRPEARELAERALALEPATTHLRMLRRPSVAYLEILSLGDDLDAAYEFAGELRARALESGDHSVLPGILANRAWCELYKGRWTDAAVSVAEALEVATDTENGALLVGARGLGALVDAHRGNLEETRAAVEWVLAIPGIDGPMFAGMLARAASGLVELSVGDAAGAWDALAPLVASVRVWGIGDPGALRWMPDGIEALVALGRFDEADELLAWYGGCARSTSRASALAAAARCRGLLCAARGDHEAARAALADSLSELERVDLPFERARTLLVVGVTERRAHRKRAARAALAEARAAFATLGARAWVEHADAEVVRIGGRRAADGELTEAEERVARLVAEGHTNREVAAALFVTVHTVEAALTRVYSKLGVRSRAELAHLLGRGKV
jgi:DNA-binding CsgD family transcriptional regulator